MALALIQIFAGSFVIGLSGAMMPGPLLTATIGETARRGPLTGPLVVLGHGLLEGVLVAAILLGVAPLLERDAVFAAIAIGGAAMLAWMAVGMFRALPRLSLAAASDDARRGNRVVTGAIVSAANPYWVLWWATVGLGLIAAARGIGPWGIAAFFVGHVLSDLAWYGAVSAAVWKSRRLFSDRVYRGLIGVCAAILLVFAGWFLWSAAARFLG